MIISPRSAIRALIEHELFLKKIILFQFRYNVICSEIA